jgi:hypothetical protein
VTDTPFIREQQEVLRGILSEVVKEVNKANKARVLSLRSRNGNTPHILRSRRRTIEVRGLFERLKGLLDQVRDLKPDVGEGTSEISRRR